MVTEDFPNATNLLDAHHYERTREHAAGATIVSVVTGQRSIARQAFGSWSRHRCLAHTVASHLDAPTLGRQLAAYDSQCAVLFLPSREELVQAFGAALHLSELQPQRAVAIVVPVPDLEDLLSRNDDMEGQLRRALLGGLVFATPEAARAAPAVRQAQDTLYRSDHESVLHGLMRNHPQIGDLFAVNKRVRPSESVKRSFEIDFWAASLRLALEVDGRQHATAKQRARDNERDQAMDAAGIKTLRVHASRVILDPTATVNQVVAVIADRRKELEREQPTD